MPAVRREQVADEARSRRSKAHDAWDPHPSLQDLLRDHYPLEWEKIRFCRTGTQRADVDKRSPDRYRVYSKRSCGVRPWCIHCNDSAHKERIHAARERIEYCTPAGQDVRLIHIVQTFPHFASGEGYGHLVYQDPNVAFEIMDEQLRWAFGDGIGWVGTFQAFGEEGPRQIHPHMDFTLNGYNVTDDVSLVKGLTLEGGGWEAWQANLRKIAERHFPGKVGPETARWFYPTRGFVRGWPAYYRAIKYQTRELVDPRKIVYDRDAQTVNWWSYPKDGQPERATTYPIHDWMAAVEAYRWRFRQWQQGSLMLTRYYGHMSDRTWKGTAKVTGGKPSPHYDGCTCRDCGDWERAFIPEAGDALLDSSPL